MLTLAVLYICSTDVVSFSLCPTQLNSTQLNPTQPNPTQPNPTQPNPTQPNPTQRNATQRNATQLNSTQLDYADTSSSSPSSSSSSCHARFFTPTDLIFYLRLYPVSILHWVFFVFFSSRLFDHRLSSSKDSFTGQSPGIGHDGSHLYTGGPRMCIGEGQVQAGLLRRGLGVCCSGGGWRLQRGSH